MPRTTSPAHLSPEQFRALAHQTLDLILDYHATIDQRPVRSRVDPGDVLAALPERPPEQPGDQDEWPAILDDVRRIILPALTHWQSPGFFGYFPANGSWPAVLGDLLSTGLGVQGMLWQTSPAITELETRMLDWMARLCGLPEIFLSTGEGGGVIQGTASEATLVAMVAARHRLRTARPQIDPRTLVAYTSNQAHSSVLKATRIAGIEHLRLIATDANHAMDPVDLARQFRDDLSQGLTPFYVCATAGTTSSGAFDPIDAIASTRTELAPDAWLHVDAAWAGSAAVCPEHRGFLEGLSGADSYCTNPHKWLLTNFDCDLFYVADRQTLIDSLSVTPEYLRNSATDSGAVIDYRDWQVPLGRRFRALKLWFVMRHYGAEGLQAHIRQHVAWAEWLEQQVLHDDRFELAAPRSLSLVCLRLAGDRDAQTQALLEAANATGKVLLTHTTLPTQDARQRYAIRVAIGGSNATFESVRALWNLLATHAPDARRSL
ncbi:MAG: pyridoxal-dependent decarboxylase [Phycisphaerales bacterium]